MSKYCIESSDHIEEEDRIRNFFESGEILDDKFQYPIGDGYNANLFRCIYGSEPEDLYIAVEFENMETYWKNKFDPRLNNKDKLKPPDNRDPEYWVTRSQAENLVNGMALANRKHGLVFNAMVTIAFKYAGIVTDKEASEVLVKFLDLMRKKFRNGSFSSRVLGVPIDPTVCVYVYVWERSIEHGLHVHILTYWPQGLLLEFRQWAEKALGRLAPIPIMENAIVAKSDASLYVDEQIKQQATMVGYLLKGIVPDMMIDVGDGSGESVSGYKVFNVKPRYRYNCGRIEGNKRVGMSRNISISERNKSPAKTMLDLKFYDQIFDGHEWELYREDCERDDLVEALKSL